MSSFQQLVDVRGESECARLAERFQAAYPFPHVCIDGFFRPEFIARLVAQFPAAGTPEYDRFCAGEGEGPRRNYANSEPASFPPAFRELDAVCAEPEFLDYLTRITGIPGFEADPSYFGAGIRESRNGAMTLTSSIASANDANVVTLTVVVFVPTLSTYSLVHVD